MKGGKHERNKRIGHEGPLDFIRLANVSPGFVKTFCHETFGYRRHAFRNLTICVGANFLGMGFNPV